LITKDVYLNPVINNVPRLLGLLNRNISSTSYGCFDRDYWHYNIIDFACARKQEAVLTLTLLYLLKHEKNKYFRSNEILRYIRAALMFWTKIQNKNGSFSEWYPNENSFVVTSFSTYAVSESLLLIKDELPEQEYQSIIRALIKAGEWLLKRHETRVMNQQTGAAIALLNIYLLTNENKFLDSSKNKITVLKQRQSREGWFIEYGGPDIGYLSLAIDYLCKYYIKTKDERVKDVVDRALSFIKYFIQPNLIAGGEYTSRNTEYLIPHGFEIFSKNNNEDALLIASIIRKSLLRTESFPNFFDDRYLTYVGYTWLQAYLDANPELDELVEDNINKHFNKPFKEYFVESGMLIINDAKKHFVVNLRKGGSFRLYGKKIKKTFSDSGILVNFDRKWYTSGWLAKGYDKISDSAVTISGNMWRVPDKALAPFSNILLRLFQITFGRWAFISLWLKEHLRNILISKARPSGIKYKRELNFDTDSDDLLTIKDFVFAGKKYISLISVGTKNTIIYVPSSRYYVGIEEKPLKKSFSPPVSKAEIDWKIREDDGIEFMVQ